MTNTGRHYEAYSVYQIFGYFLINYNILKDYPFNFGIVLFVLFQEKAEY